MCSGINEVNHLDSLTTLEFVGSKTKRPLMYGVQIERAHAVE